ncbi:MAG TPA: site-2 protease family protein [Nitrososphaeraceae archaeon]|nr:site-2 protease family protein [Nitrososphaeraceae archaeon]
MSVTIARVKGVKIRIHFTFFIVFGLITWTLSIHLFPMLLPGFTYGVHLFVAVVAVIILFASVILHELAHSIMATRYGIKVRQIILFIFGGVSDIEEEPRDFQKEFKIAIVGPLTSFALAGIFLLLSFLIESIASGSNAPIIIQATDAILSYGALVNLMLGAFNLLPAFPLDGGRILRTVLIKRRRDYDAATKIVVRTSIIISYVLMGIGFLSIVTGSFVGGFWILLIGWFLNSGAQSYLQQQELASVLSDVRLGDIMNTNIIAVRTGSNLNDIFRNFFEVYMKTAFPIIDDSGSLLGLITLPIATNVSKDNRQFTIVDDIMIRRNDLILMDYNNNAYEALNEIARRKVNMVFVCEASGKIQGLVTKTDILAIAAERQKYFQTLKKK